MGKNNSNSNYVNLYVSTDKFIYGRQIMNHLSICLIYQYK